MYIMDEQNVQRNENKKHRKLVRSHEKISPSSENVSSPNGGIINRKSSSASMTMVFPTSSTANSTTTVLTMMQSPKEPSPSTISPHTLNKSFDQSLMQTPAQYQMYHQFSRTSSTTQQYIQYQQNFEQTLSTSPTNQHPATSRKSSLTQSTQGEPPDTRISHSKSSIQQSKPMDQRSNNPFILNFNNISGCCIKNSPTSSNSPCSSSPTTNVTTTTSATIAKPTPAIPTRRSRSLLLKSSSSQKQIPPTGQSSSTPLSSTPGPPVPPRLNKSTTPTKDSTPLTLTSPVIITSPTSVLTPPLIKSTNCCTPSAPSNHNEKPPPLLTSSSDGGTSIQKKRDDFLKATMKICLVVSPPSCKLQLKSRSLTHLDKLESLLATPNNIPNDYHRLNLFKVSSSEYFSVLFETGENDGFRDEILIPASKGICLADSLHSSLLQRSLSFSQICVTDNGFSNSQELGVQYLGPLDAYTDISSLAGRTLIVSDKDSVARKPGGHTTLQKAASVGYRSTSNRLFTSTSTDETYDQSPKAASSSSSKQSKQKWTISFGSKGPQKSKLCELLDSYNKGIPKLTSSASNFDKPEYLEALDGLINLPQSWTDIVNCVGMGEVEMKIQSAIWELVTTEVYYILALQTVTDLFLACLEDIQSHNILIDVDQNKLFSNIRDICESNLKFWTLYLYPMVRECMETKTPMSIFKFKDGFMEFSSIFNPYTKYCAEQSICQYYCKELYQNNSLFMSYCAWCESQKMCNRLRLADILVRPMQRLTKYGLLLVAIKKHIVDENEGEAIDEMIHSVEEFVAGVNSHLTTRQENERLKGINARIESYEVVDCNNEILDKMVKQYSTMFDLCLPMQGTNEGRKLFLEGDLKFKDSLGKMDVHCFLLTDFLLICKKNKHENLKIVRQPYMTDRLAVQLKEQTLYCCYLNELNIVVTAFTLHCSKAPSWYDSITKAKHIYSRLKQGPAADLRQYTNVISVNNSNSNNVNVNNDSLSIRRSPLNSSIGSRVSSLNNSHSGSVDLNESKPVSIDFEKANSLSSDEGGVGVASLATQGKVCIGGARKMKSTVTTMHTSSNSLTVQPFSGLGQSMPNLNLNSIQNSIVYSNTLSVPSASGGHSHSGMVLLSPSQRGISYPPPSPTRATLRRGFAFSSSIKNPPLLKTRNVPSQQSFILSQQTSFNSATLSQHQQCLQTSPSPSGPPNVAFIKRKNSFQSQNQSAPAAADPNTPSGDTT
ncbi:pleckstrin homology domain-containing family G member 5 isoform X6 [Toxorhynchites rutilus septentrionalis]|uniref:pleckstrin homology domain-containing family G member 5 isoform X6 n=1 Tax=Toxorhynchites rutilus septentrionalis TaxID=329112 RepID=UPI00247B0870|nr:pleckstrin homology domain-containing family G member 5 isoform X6 [Toxorhynchites rutilus septentrionalis]